MPLNYAAFGLATNDELYNRLTGKEFRGAKALPIVMSAKTDAGDECRRIMRTLNRVGEADDRSSVQEMKAVSGAAYRLIFTLERPTLKAKRLLIDLPAADLGGIVPVRFSVPAGPAWKIDS